MEIREENELLRAAEPWKRSWGEIMMLRNSGGN
jgi:hypothetical protein